MEIPIREDKDIMDTIFDAKRKGLISTRAANILMRYGIHRIGDLAYISKEDLRCFRTAGKKTQKEIETLADLYGLTIPEKIDQKTRNRLINLWEGDIIVNLFPCLDTKWRTTLPEGNLLKVLERHNPAWFLCRPVEGGEELYILSAMEVFKVDDGDGFRPFRYILN